MTARVAPEISVEDVCVAAYGVADLPVLRDEGAWHGCFPVTVDEPRLEPRPRVQVQRMLQERRRKSREKLSFHSIGRTCTCIQRILPMRRATLTN